MVPMLPSKIFFSVYSVYTESVAELWMGSLKINHSKVKKARIIVFLTSTCHFNSTLAGKAV